MIAAIDFVDLQDNNYLYHAGDKFPRDGVVVSDDRIAELSGSDNKLGQPLIIDKAVAKEEKKAEPKVEEPKEEPKEEAKPKTRRKKNDN